MQWYSDLSLPVISIYRLAGASLPIDVTCGLGQVHIWHGQMHAAIKHPRVRSLIQQKRFKQGLHMSSKVMLINPKRFGDDRGWFTEVYSTKKFSDIGIADEFVQDNHSLSTPAGTLRGLHFQTPPYGQAKLVRCIRGKIFDVAVDVRRGSPTYGKWVGAELSAENGRQLYIPVGFAHGFVTLEPSTEVTYKVTNFYAPANDSGILWNDANVNIVWPLPAGVDPLLSPKDEKQPLLSAFDSPFSYDGQPLELFEI
jgi:dTDP-4-dehydrorhamnose 3,5-epimerase